MRFHCACMRAVIWINSVVWYLELEFEKFQFQWTGAVMKGHLSWEFPWKSPVGIIWITAQAELVFNRNIILMNNVQIMRYGVTTRSAKSLAGLKSNSASHDVMAIGFWANDAWLGQWRSWTGSHLVECLHLGCCDVQCSIGSPREILRSSQLPLSQLASEKLEQLSTEALLQDFICPTRSSAMPLVRHWISLMWGRDKWPCRIGDNALGPLYGSYFMVFSTQDKNGVPGVSCWGSTWWWSLWALLFMTAVFITSVFWTHCVWFCDWYLFWTELSLP